MSFKSLSKILNTTMERPTFVCDVCPRSFLTQRALAAHRRWHCSSSKHPAITNKRGYTLRKNPRKSMRIDDPKFFDATSIVQDDVEGDNESLEEVDAACILVQLAQKGKMVDGSSDYEMRRKGKTLAIVATEIEEGKMQSADRSEDAIVLHDQYEAIALLNGSRNGFICKECNIAFPTYQALGGHRSGHAKKIASAARASDSPARSKGCKLDSIARSNSSKFAEGASYPNIYTCLYCAQEFPTGHAFGGHKRSRACRSNYRDAGLYEPPLLPQPESPPPPQLSPPPSPGQPVRFLLDLNKPPPNDNDS